MNQIIHKAPDAFDLTVPSIFLAGSIDNDAAANWQMSATQQLAQLIQDKHQILNPRRELWDSSMSQLLLNPKFAQQVAWEHAAMDHADIILMWFESTSKSPITLLELGEYSRSDKLVVGCPSDFWRYGNVEYVCVKYNIPLFNTIELLISAVSRKFGTVFKR